MMEMLFDEGLVASGRSQEAIDKKKLKVEEFLKLSKQQGTLID